MQRVALLVVLPVVVALAGAACEEPEILDQGCVDDSDCANREICEGAVCIEVGPCAGDPDGDGRGEGCAAGPDCDEGDPEAFRELPLFVDADGDGVGVGPGELTCAGNQLPAGLTSVEPAADDCDDEDERVFRAVELAVDLDEDGVGAGPAALTCVGEDLPPGTTDNPVDEVDCDDDDPDVFTLRSLHADSDGDGVGLGAVELVCTNGEVPVGFTDQTPAVADCDDFDAARAPGQPEVCDGLDNSCSGVADDEGVCPCPVFYDGDDLRPYLVCADARSWAHADAACRRLPHYRLLKIDDQAENDFIRAVPALDHWMSLNDLAAPNSFVWHDGTAPQTTFFDAGEPNGNGDCGYMRAGGWSDHPCEEHRGFVCEAHPELRDLGQACVDGDGDGFGQSCLAGEDCDDTDDQVYGWLTGFADQDLDGFTAGHRELVCTDGALPANFAAEVSATTDCDDTDDALQAGCAPCNTYLRDGVSYSVCFGQQDDWQTTNNFCFSTGRGSLVSLGTKAEADFFQDMVLAVDPAVGNWWIGMHDRDDLGATEDNHVWIDGTPVDAFDFAAGQPNNSDNQDCVAWQPAGWNDVGCGNTHRFVCER